MKGTDWLKVRPIRMVAGSLWIATRACAGARIPATLLLILTLPTRPATFLPPSRTSKTSHDGSMEREHAETSLGQRGLRGALANKRAADSRARALVQIIQELRAAGIISRPALAQELSRRGIPTAQAGKWHTNTMVRMLKRLGLLTPGKGGRINNGQVGKQVADTRAKKLAPTIRALQAKGFISFDAIARELNRRKVPSALGGRWHGASVRRLLRRLKKAGA
jgi:hypothetical protein